MQQQKQKPSKFNFMQDEGASLHQLRQIPLGSIHDQGLFHVQSEPNDKSQMENTQKKIKKLENVIFVGSFFMLGTCKNPDFDTKGKTVELQLQKGYSTILYFTVQSYKISLQILFSNFLIECIQKKFCIMRFYCKLNRNKIQQYRIVNNKLRLPMRIIFPVRMDFYLNQNLFKTSIIRQPSTEDDEYQQYQSRCILTYLIQKSKVKVLNKGLAIPSSNLNLMKRKYRLQLIGNERIVNKNHMGYRNPQEGKRRISFCQMYYPCISKEIYNQNNPQFDIFTFYGDSLSFFINWQQLSLNQNIQKMLNFEAIKAYYKNYGQSTPQQNILLLQHREKIMKQIGFYDNAKKNQIVEIQIQNNQMEDQSLQQQQQQQIFNIQQEERIANLQMRKKIQEENSHFLKHKTPSVLRTKLLDHQAQALQWMKIRQGKIKSNQIFQQNYMHSEQNEFQRNLSYFWQQLLFPSGKILYLNYFTGRISKQKVVAKQVKGGILADEMGLGKTVMILALLADEQFIGTTIIVVPPMVLEQWYHQIKKYCGPNVPVYKFYGGKCQQRRMVDLNKYSIVLITYQTLGEQHKAYINQRQKSITKFIYHYQFRRVILDQAHQIKNISTRKFNSTSRLKSEYKWCLTGSLIQCSQKDLQYIFSFLNVQFLNNYLRWRRYISECHSIQSKLNILYTMLRPILLRRTIKKVLNLPPKHEHKIKIDFSQQQRYLYSTIKKGTLQNLNSLKAKNKIQDIQNCSVMNKLRLFCGHPELVLNNVKLKYIQNNGNQQIIDEFFFPQISNTFKIHAFKNFDQEIQKCIVCFNEPTQNQMALSRCGHNFCLVCIRQALTYKRSCPICKHPLKISDIITNNQIQNQKQKIKKKQQEILRVSNNSTKMAVILSILQQITKRNEKCVIFTQWLMMISLLQLKLNELKFKVSKIIGSMSISYRQKCIQTFQSSQDYRFLLISMRTGNLGINLQNCNNVIICQPCWNPNQEDQAIGRVYRLGQKYPVNVYKLYMKNSIQQIIEKINNEKRVKSKQLNMESENQSNYKYCIEDILEMLNDEKDIMVQNY